MYITNNEEIAKIAQKAGVDWIFVDLEIKGKKDRQEGRNTVISAHTIEDVKNLREVIDKSKLLVRINPMGEWSKQEVNDVIKAGAEIIMLPYFKTKQEVEKFVNLVDKKVKTCLLVETMEAVGNIEDILEVKGIDYIHIGLNDIHIQRKTDFMFEFLADGYIDVLANKIKQKDLPFGFGGVAHMQSDLLPLAKDIIAEHYRVGSTGVILSRSFIHNNQSLKDFEKEFIKKVEELRRIEKELQSKDKSFFEKNREIVKNDIYKVRDIIKAKK
jgi:2-methylisocitrate lyase-like PEP mutase family enzyme